MSGHKATTWTIGSDNLAETTYTTEGTRNIVVTTTDNAGNTASVIYVIRIDKTAPTVGTLIKKVRKFKWK